MAIAWLSVQKYLPYLQVNSPCIWLLDGPWKCLHIWNNVSWSCIYPFDYDKYPWSMSGVPGRTWPRAELRTRKAGMQWGPPATGWIWNDSGWGGIKMRERMRWEITRTWSSMPDNRHILHLWPHTPIRSTIAECHAMSFDSGCCFCNATAFIG